MTTSSSFTGPSPLVPPPSTEGGSSGFGRPSSASLVMRLQGYLLKKGDKGLVKSYKKRWFVLAGNIMSYSKERDQAAIGVILLDQFSVACAEPGTEAEFQISNRYKKRVYYLQAGSSSERDKWLMEVIEAIRGEMTRPGTGSIKANRRTADTVEPSVGPGGIATQKVISSPTSAPPPSAPPPLPAQSLPPAQPLQPPQSPPSPHAKSNVSTSQHRQSNKANALRVSVYGLAPRASTTAFAPVRRSVIDPSSSSSSTPPSAGEIPSMLDNVTIDDVATEGPPEITIDEGTTFTVEFGQAYKIDTPSDTYAVFAMEVKVGTYTYILTRRYAEFRALHEKLIAKHEGKILFPPFPPKTPFKTLASEIEKRRTMLAEYFKELLRLGTLQKDEMILRFFGINVRERSHTQKMLSTPVPQALPPVQLSKLAARVEKLSGFVGENGENGFEKEYAYIEAKSIADMAQLSFNSALLPHNKVKNRYNNVLAPDHSRVQLMTLECDDGSFLEGSDYINANWIPGWTKGGAKFIAAQGPTAVTLFDFFRLIWETNTPIVVMLTNLVEGGKLKCEPYWADGVADRLQVFVFEVRSEIISETPELVCRRLTLTNMVMGESRTVTHFQFVAWPDHGLPSSAVSFLRLVHNVSVALTETNKINPSQSPVPVVVHCSAGIGRTGTFCFLYYMLEKLASEIANPGADPLVSVGEHVLLLRQQRPGMVQTKEQYTFCYLALLEASKSMLKYRKEIAEHTLKNIMQETLSLSIDHGAMAGTSGAPEKPNEMEDLDNLLADLETIKARKKASGT